MDHIIWTGALTGTLAGLALTAHVGSAIIAGRRLKHRPQIEPPTLPAVTIIRPVCGLDPVEMATLASTFQLPLSAELIFCAARETDKAVPYLRQLITRYPGVNAVIMIGTDGPGINPKLDNVRKGWLVARNDWVVIADSNVLMDDTYLWNLLSAWRDDVGAVCVPPFAVDGIGLWSAVETQFLNGYQGRWQYTADALGTGFAQGKSMLFRKSLLDQWGGIDALDEDTAEDAAATKVVRRNGFRVRLAPRTVAQPLGRRSLQQVWQRQCRWAQLRRQSFPALYLLEPLTMLLPTLAAAAVFATAQDLLLTETAMLVASIWLGADALLAQLAGWRFGPSAMIGIAAREIMSPLVWCAGWRVKPFTWRQPRNAGLEPQLA
jgi:ceramide glucosyltransferase